MNKLHAHCEPDTVLDALGTRVAVACHHTYSILSVMFVCIEEFMFNSTTGLI